MDAASRNLVANMSSGIVGRLVAVFLGMQAVFRKRDGRGGVKKAVDVEG